MSMTLAHVCGNSFLVPDHWPIVAYHVQRFPTAGPVNVALKIAEEAGELASAVNGYVSGGDFGKGDVVYEAVDTLLAIRALLGRWFPDVDPDAEVEARIALFQDPNGGHWSCIGAK
jgi:hypothetical protein